MAVTLNADKPHTTKAMTIDQPTSIKQLPNGQWQHEPSGAYLHKEIAQPHVTSFHEVFEAWEPWRLFDKAYKPAFAPRSVSGQNLGGNIFKNAKRILTGDGRRQKYPDEHMLVGPFCSRRDGGSMAVRCADWVLSRIKERAIVIGDDRMSFEIVDHDNGWSLVIANHGVICGGVWLAYIRTETIPADTKERIAQ